MRRSYYAQLEVRLVPISFPTFHCQQDGNAILGSLFKFCLFTELMFYKVSLNNISKIGLSTKLFFACLRVTCDAMLQLTKQLFGYYCIFHACYSVRRYTVLNTSTSPILWLTVGNHGVVCRVVNCEYDFVEAHLSHEQVG